MFELRSDDVFLIGIAGSVIQIMVYALDLLETAKVIPFGPSRLRDMFRTSFWLWLITVLPTSLICLCALWFCLRLVMPENFYLAGGIFISLLIVTTGINIARIVALRKTARTHHEAAYKHLRETESHLKSLAEGPMIVDEELDLKVLELRKRITKAREKLGIKDDSDSR